MPPFMALRKCGALAIVGVLPCLTAVAGPFAPETGTLRGTRCGQMPGDTSGSRPCPEGSTPSVVSRLDTGP